MYTKTTWAAWEKAELENYQLINNRKKYIKKGYLHFDHRFWFPDRKKEIEVILENKLIQENVKNGMQSYYAFTPFLKILTKTPRYRYQFEEGHYDLETKIRPICLTSHQDSLIYGYYSHYLTKVYESFLKAQKIDDVVLAYRTDLGHCNIQFAKQVFNFVQERKNCTTIALDIKGYFDHIDHGILLKKWQKVIGGRLPEDQYRLYKVLTEYSYVNLSSILKKYKGPKLRNEKSLLALFDIIPGNSFNEKFKQLRQDDLIVTNNQLNETSNRKCGIPQGTPISALLSNIFLIDFDAELKHKGNVEDFIYRRYCDDLIIICNTDHALKILNWVTDKIMEEYFLTIQPEKVDMIDFHKNSAGKMRGFRRQRKSIRTPKGTTIKSFSSNPALTKKENEDKFYKPLQYLGFEYNGKNILLRSSSLSRFFRKLNYRLQRTVIMSYSPNSISNQIFMKQIYERYTHIGTRNFLSYAYKAAKEFYEEGGVTKNGMNSPAIRRQLRNHFSLLRHELDKKNFKWYSHKSKRKKVVTPKYFK